MTTFVKRSESYLNNKSIVVVASTITFLSLALYIGLTVGQLGTYNLALDDAWIHQTYARNLARGEWFTYTDHRASTGSTSPAWTMLLSLGYLLGIKPIPWSLLLSALFHIMTVVVVYHLSLLYFKHRWLAFWSAVLTAFEWHLVWAVLSGMETTMFVALSVLYLYLIQKQKQQTWPLGLLGGLLFLTRPEGSLLVGITGFKILWTERFAWRQAVKSLVILGFAFLLVIGPFMVFNTAVSGRPMPGTFHAKFVQWIAPWTIGKALDYWRQLFLWFFFRGSLFLFTPLGLIGIWIARRRRRYQLLPAVAWWIGLPLAYTFLMPSLGERGRYLMPLIPVVIILGASTIPEILKSSQWQRLGWTLIGLSTLMTVIFWANGPRAYMIHVRSIESQHMAVAQWLRTHTLPDAVVATQDIGVLGYFSDRRLIDMAGLTEPAVVPIMHQPQQMAAYIRQHGGDYVVVFPSYYQELIQDQNLKLLFVSDKYDFWELGADPLAVFEFPATEEAESGH